MTQVPHESPQTANLQPVGRARGGRARAWVWALGVLAIFVISGGVWYFGVRRAEDPHALWLEAEADLKAERIDLAAAAANRLRHLRDPAPPVMMLLAQVDIAQGRDDDAITQLLQVPEDNQLAAQARLLAGQVELRRHRARFAEKYFRMALQLDPSLVQAHRELIYILGFQLRRADLNAEFRALSQLTDLNYESVFHWCLLRTALWEPSTALTELLLFVQADPEDRDSRLAIAENYRRMGVLDDAEATIASLPDSDREALAIRVMLAMDRHQIDKADEFLASVPSDDVTLAKLRGRLALARRDGLAAVRYFRLAFDHTPDDRDAVLGLANALTLVGDDNAAAPLRDLAKKYELLNSLVLRAGIPRERSDPNLVRELGAACVAAGRYPEARSWYRVAIARDPLDVESQRALFQIESRDRQKTDRGDGRKASNSVRDHDRSKL